LVDLRAVMLQAMAMHIIIVVAEAQELQEMAQ
jgi:hypothetical protein